MRIILLLMLLALPSIVSAQIVYIELEHRQAMELQPFVSGILKENEKVTAAGQVLILQMGETSQQTVRELIAVLDRPVETLMVRLQQQQQGRQDRGDSRTRVTVGTTDGVNIEKSGARTLSTHQRHHEQRLLVNEGSYGLIEVGKDIPYTRDWAVLSGRQTGYSESIAYLPIRTGFSIIPIQVSKDRVLIEVEPVLMEASGAAPLTPPTVNSQHLRTRLWLPFDQWVELGGQFDQQDQFARAIIRSTAERDNNRSAIYIRIERVTGFSP